MSAHGPAAPRPVATGHRPWPTPQDYNEAVQNPALNFADPELRGGTPELTPLGLPRAITGGFASVYQLRCGGGSWAVRCFLREVPDQQERYAAIGRHLATAKLPATVGFTFQADGIRVGGRPYPILKMGWLQGEPLDRWIERHLGDAAALRALADRWVAMLRDLRRASVAHGDLQHGNVLVVGGELRLIDYDGLYVPALTGRGATEVGHRNYQHPRRGAADYGPHLDHFAAWSIFLSLRALAVEPGLWARLGAGDEALLLRREDYERPASSAALTAMAALPDPALPALVGRFRALLDQEVADLPPLDGTEPPRRAARRAPPVRALDRPAPAPRVEAASWLADHLPAPPPRRIEASPVPERGWLGTAALALLAAAVAALAGPLAGGAALACAALVVALAGLGLAGRFLALPTTPGLLAARWRLLRARARAVWWGRLAGGLGVWTERVMAREAARLAALAEARQERARAVREARGVVRRSLEAFDAERRRLREAEEEELADALRRHQQRAVAAPLAGCAILDAALPGLGAQATLHLLKAGIRTAADVAGCRVSRPAGAGGEVVEIAVPGRGWVQVEGIGRKRGQALLDWRRSLIAQAGITPPAALPPEGEAAIRLRHHTRLAAFERRVAAATRRAARQDEAIRERGEDERAELALRADETRQRAALARARCAALDRAARTRLAAAHLAATLARRDLAAYRDARFAAYLRVVLGIARG